MNLRIERYTKDKVNDVLEFERELRRQEENTYYWKIDEHIVLRDGKEIGCVKISENRFHAGNCYIQLHLENYDVDIAGELFEKLAEEVSRPLQVMISSEELEQIAFLEKGGFQCKRKCFEAEVVRGDYIAEVFEKVDLCYCEKSSPEYDRCGQLLYQHYARTHENISPLTVDYTEFAEGLPPQVFYQCVDKYVASVAFVEENEIAYVASADGNGFKAFVRTLVEELFERYGSLMFECDDCDPVAMELYSLFRVEEEESYNTYIREPSCKGTTMDKVEIYHNRMEEAISIMREVASWGREQGIRVWPLEWLTPEELITDEAGPENFFVGTVDGQASCAFILQNSDREYWGETPANEAVYLHKLCVRRQFAHRGMTKAVVEAIKIMCRGNGIKYIRLDTGLDEKKVRKLYLKAGFKIVDIIDYDNGRSLALYEMEV